MPLPSRLLAIALPFCSFIFIAACTNEDGSTLEGDPAGASPNAPSNGGSNDPNASPSSPASSPDAGADAQKPVDAAPLPPVVAPVIATLENEVKTRSPGTELGMAVFDLVTNEYAGTNDDVQHVSASAPKAIWVAAALSKVGIDPVTPYAKPIFEQSSNDDATAVIKLAGPNYINDFYALAGMKKSAFTQWFGGQVATNSPKALGSDNYITAKDSISFLTGVSRGTLLDAANTAQLKEWMTWSPRTGFGGWLGTLLPPSAKDSMMHKAGWLPPPYEDRCVNEIGLVQAQTGHWYAIAILARYADDYTAEQRFVEHASCAIYKAVAASPALDCK